jgi:hypothetical protein
VLEDFARGFRVAPEQLVFRDGFFARGGYSIDDIAARAATASRSLVTP